MLTLSGLFSYVNYRYVRLRETIGVMFVALVASLLLIAADALGLHLRDDAGRVLSGMRFEQTLMLGLVGFLLFAGALQIELSELAAQKVEVVTLATVGLVGSTFLVGGFIFLLFLAIGSEIDWIHAVRLAPGKMEEEGWLW